MARKSTRKEPEREGPDLFAESRARTRRRLILPSALEEEAAKQTLRGPDFDRAGAILTRWADLDSKGHLRSRKETDLDANFLQEVFCDALGFVPASISPEDHTLARQFPISGIGMADAAIGRFGGAEARPPVAVVELKGARVDLDQDRSNGRTAVHQLWDYLNALPECPWGIVSNFETIRLYHRNKTQLAYEEFTLQDLREPAMFREFYCLFHRDGMLPSAFGQPPRAARLLELSDSRRLEVGDRLYGIYSRHRSALIRHLLGALGKTRDAAIRIAQKILDRVVFIAFCEQRGLLPDKCLDAAYATLPPFSKVTNPRWRNFLDLFQAVDSGHDRLDLKKGYNGGLFKHDPEVDDLQLDDAWTDTLHEIAGYDFKEEVNVDVLGHLFERSIGDLERLRREGIPRAEAPFEVEPTAAVKMPKSAERKRFGVYYTPPDFTRRIVRETVRDRVASGRDRLLAEHGLTPADLLADRPSERIEAFWRACWADLRSIKVVDPACGSGAFLIRAYDVFEDEYRRAADQIAFHAGPAAEGLADEIPDLILGENLFGVDLSEEAVEIARLALWIRSAKRGRTLADLSRHVVRRNSLVDDPTVHPLAIDWNAEFPAVFDRPGAGFDCVIGNPPWERLKLQEREFFAHSAPEIAEAVSAAARRTRIAGLEAANPTLFAEYQAAKRSAEAMLDHARNSGRYPLAGQGDVNTYMLFAELARRIVAPAGRVGLLVPSGVATDHTSKEFFGTLVGERSLIALYDFENKAPVFPDVHRSFKFSILIYGGRAISHEPVDFVFFAREVEDLDDKKRHIPLTTKDIALFNPNTRTCPIFRSRRDATITKGIYRRVPILLDESRERGGNPWGVKYRTMFHQTNDAELFVEAEALRARGLRLVGNRWLGEGKTYLPLYEAKMIQAFDHRAAGVVVKEGNWVRQGQTEATSLVEHRNPEFTVQPRWWVDDEDVTRACGDRGEPYFLAYKDVTSPTNTRTMIASFIPRAAVVNSAPLMKTAPEFSVRSVCGLLANLNALVLDYVARQKVGGVHLNFFIINQLPMLAPDAYSAKCPWDRRQTLEKWISDRVLKLSCTADDMRPLASAAGFAEGVHRWDVRERTELTAELDAAYFMLYGLDRDDVEYVLGTFRSLEEDAPPLPGVPTARRLILQRYDAMAERVVGG